MAVNEFATQAIGMTSSVMAQSLPPQEEVIATATANDHRQDVAIAQSQHRQDVVIDTKATQQQAVDVCTEHLEPHR